MNWFAKMDRKYGKYAIKNLSLYIAIAYGFGFLMSYIKPEWVYFVTLNPYAILHGQVWRLISWILVPDGPGSIFFVAIFLYFYFSVGRDLEVAWGRFAFNFFIFMGIGLTILSSFILFGYFFFLRPDYVDYMNTLYSQYYGASTMAMGGPWFYIILSNSIGTTYLNLSIFLAFAITYPNARILLFFILPIKAKVLSVIYLVVLGFTIFTSFLKSFDSGMISLVSIGSSLLNVAIFFIIMKKNKARSMMEIKRQKEFKKKVKEASKPVSQIRHKCAICGRTDVSNPELTFRYCSKCNGNYEYCNEHLFTHKHQ